MIPKCIVVVLVAAALGSDVEESCDEKVDDRFRAEQVVPDVVKKSPNGYAYVKYPNGVEAQLGNELTPLSTRDVPAVFWDADLEPFYLLAMVDPDVPSRANPTDGQLLHWLVGNIPGDYIHSIDKCDVLAEYIGPAPGPFTDLHRYVFLIWQQPSKLTFDEPRINDTTVEGRPKFSMEAFAAKYNLGCLVAGNFFKARYDDYVPIARAQANDYSLLYCLTGEVVCK